MTHNIYRWIYPDPVPLPVNENLDAFSVPFRSILYRRGCLTMDDALSILVPKDPSHPEGTELRHLDKACDLIKTSHAKYHKVAVYGDYDTDGITSTALLTLALRKIFTQVIPFIPNRISDGYGLNTRAIDLLHKQGTELLITVDNGIRSVDEIAYAKSLGMSVIITDHHHPPEVLPDADAIINPKLPDDPYPNKSLAGVGVAYKLVCRLADYFSEIHPSDYLDLVALGTVADIVPLLGENRSLVKRGLLKINQNPTQSLHSLIGAAGLDGNQITSSDISYQISPRINSSGRLADTENHLAPLELLLSTEPSRCGEFAQILENHNNRRKALSQQLQDQLESVFADKDRLPFILISLEPDNYLGVAGIAAGSLTHKYYLPAVVGSVGQEFTKASCRSIPEFDLISALSKTRELFKQYGGHKLAAGFTIENKNIPKFRQRFLDLAEQELADLDLQPSLAIDAVVSLSECDDSFYRELNKLEPTGEGNPTPLLVVRDVFAQQKNRVGKYNEHLKLMISDGTSEMAAIAFGLGDSMGSLPDKFNLAGHFTENEFRGVKEYQFRIVDLESSD